jgi:hypothetical protein
VLLVRACSIHIWSSFENEQSRRPAPVLVVGGDHGGGRRDWSTLVGLMLTQSLSPLGCLFTGRPLDETSCVLSIGLYLQEQL